MDKNTYVLATRWNDGSCGDPWCVGFYKEVVELHSESAAGISLEYIVVDEYGTPFPGTYCRVEAITQEEGDWILSYLKTNIERLQVTHLSLWDCLKKKRSGLL